MPIPFESMVEEDTILRLLLGDPARQGGKIRLAVA